MQHPLQKAASHLTLFKGLGIGHWVLGKYTSISTLSFCRQCCMHSPHHSHWNTSVCSHHSFLTREHITHITKHRHASVVFLFFPTSSALSFSLIGHLRTLFVPLPLLPSNFSILPVLGPLPPFLPPYTPHGCCILFFLHPSFFIFSLLTLNTSSTYPFLHNPFSPS